LWSGVISFGLVQIPVGLHSAESHSDDLALNLLDVKDHAPVGYQHINKVTGEPVPKERRVKGYEVAKNQYVILTDADFKAANVKATETVDIQAFVDAEEIPSLRYERPYWLSPQKKGAKPYVLLRQALQMTGKVAVATIVMRQRQHLCAVFPSGDALALQMLRYDDEVRGADDVGIDEELKGVHLKPAEIEMATRLVEGMQGPFDTREFKDTYKDDLMAMIEARKTDPYYVPEAPKKQKAAEDTSDLMALLEQSVQSRPSRAAHPTSQAKSSSSKRSAARSKRTRTAHKRKSAG
jgi:DNA end-binding protein Ku